MGAEKRNVGHIGRAKNNANGYAKQTTEIIPQVSLR